MTAAVLERPAAVLAPSRRCEVLLRGRGALGERARRTECGENAVSPCVAVCSCGHESKRWACHTCARAAGTCRLCWDEGHECPVTITRAGGRS
jgi:hypothetical protein